MYSSISGKKGFTMIEGLIALFLISFGVLALISLQPNAWSLSGRSDFLGRGAGILHGELQTNEAFLINPCNPNPCGGVNPFTSTRNIFISGWAAAQPGDATFTVQTTVTDNGNNTWMVVVRVTWTGNNTGITESIMVTRQEPFRFPQGCV